MTKVTESDEFPFNLSLTEPPYRFENIYRGEISVTFVSWDLEEGDDRPADRPLTVRLTHGQAAHTERPTQTP